MRLNKSDIIYSIKVWMTSVTLAPVIYLLFERINRQDITSGFFTGLFIAVIAGLVISFPYLPIFYLLVNTSKKFISKRIICRVVICTVHMLFILVIFRLTWGDNFYTDQEMVAVYTISGGLATWLWKLESKATNKV